MQARESNANYPSRRREMANFAAREIKRVCKEIGPRASGEENERKAQAYLAESMKSVADSVEIEDFELHPKAFMGWVLLDVCLMLVSGVLLILGLLDVFPAASTALTAVATVLTVLSIVFLVFEFLLYKPLLDPLFPKRKSCNVICTRKPKGEVKRRIVFCGHMDSAYEWTYLRKGGGKVFAAVVGAAFGSVFVQLVHPCVSAAARHCGHRAFGARRSHDASCDPGCVFCKLEMCRAGCKRQPHRRVCFHGGGALPCGERHPL